MDYFYPPVIKISDSRPFHISILEKHTFLGYFHLYDFGEELEGAEKANYIWEQ